MSISVSIVLGDKQKSMDHFMLEEMKNQVSATNDFHSYNHWTIGICDLLKEFPPSLSEGVASEVGD